MYVRRSFKNRLFGLISLVTPLLLTTLPALAGVVLDGTMGAKGPLTGPNYNITSAMGKQYGGNLFQSFSEFNLIKNDVATFSGPASIINIICRVTGGSASSIDGTIRSTISGANLFIVNPFGMIFGSNARLDVTGSFHASTADYLKLGSDGRFDARVPEQSLLTSAPPSAFGFTSATPAPITVRDSVLEVPEGQTLSLIGGNLSLTNAVDSTLLRAPGGRLNLAAVASTGELGLTPSGIDATQFSKMGIISIVRSVPAGNYSDVSASSDLSGGGSIYISGGKFVVDHASIVSDSRGSGGGSDIVINGSESVELKNGAAIASRTYTDSLGGSIYITSPSITVSDSASVVANTYSSGNAGNISIDTGKLNILDGGWISTSALDGSSGRGGDIVIKAADSVTVRGRAGSDPTNDESALLSQTFGSGDAGNISINTGRLDILDYGTVASNAGTGSSGNGGNISIKASDTVTVKGYAGSDPRYRSSLASQAYGSGNAGDITIDTARLDILGGGVVSTSALNGSSGNGGRISITASDTITVKGYAESDPRYRSVLASDTSGSGNAGDITITTGRLDILDGGNINTSGSSSSGAGGNITIKASDTVTVKGSTESDAQYRSLLSSYTSGSGNAGDITIDTAKLDILGGGVVTTSALGGSSGRGGNITITAVDKVTVKGYAASDPQYRSQISSYTYGSGNAGDITIDTGKLSILDGGVVSTSAQKGSSGSGGNITIKASDAITVKGYAEDNPAYYSELSSETYGLGNAGDITINTGRLDILNAGAVTTSSMEVNSGKAGNITINAADSVTVKGTAKDMPDFFSELSSYTFSSKDAGDITIDTGRLNILNGGVVSTSAVTGSSGKGGNITIKATNSVTVQGYAQGAPDYFSELSSDTSGSGNAGNISIETGRLNVADNAVISTTSGASGDGGSINIKTNSLIMENNAVISSESKGTGKAGDITISSAALLKMNNSSITTATVNADGGNISIDPALVDIYNSRISTSVQGGIGDGGNIDLTAKMLVVGNSSIIANAYAGDGGNIHLISDNMIMSPTGNVISASSSLGLQGTVLISSPIVDLGSSIVDMPNKILDINAFLPKRCATTEEEISSFTVLESAVAPPNPDRPLVTP
jgi:filamentous hemagglutinin family protein